MFLIYIAYVKLVYSDEIKPRNQCLHQMTELSSAYDQDDFIIFSQKFEMSYKSVFQMMSLEL